MIKYKLIILFGVILWSCEKDVLTSMDSDQQESVYAEKSVNGKVLGPWGVPDGLLHVYGTGPSQSVAQDFPCEFKKPRKITSIWARFCRSGNPTDEYFVTLRADLDGVILAQSINVPVADVVSQFVDWQGEWVEFPLTSPYRMAAGNYFVQMERTGPGDQQNYMNWLHDGGNPLPNHAGWVKSESSEWTMFGPFLSDDYLMMISYN